MSAVESDLFEAPPRRASAGKYWSAQGWRTEHRVYTSGAFASPDLTPLEELYAPKILTLPYVIQGLLRGEFWDKVGAGSWSEKDSAAAWLEAGVKSFAAERLDVAYDFEEIEARARRYAEICRHIPTYEGINCYVESKGVDLPALSRGVSERGCVNRARTAKWWRRKLTRRYRRSAEGKLRISGFVRRRRGLYCSSFALSARRQQASNTDRYLRERNIVASDGTQLNLFDVWKGSNANPAIRRTELMTRMKGFENIARELKHPAEFITLTTPSEYHAINSDGKPNPNYKGHTVRDGQAWLNKMWARSRAAFKKRSILVYGFRVAEPHHDATPHWHMVLFTMAHHVDTLRTVLREHWLSECGSERGAADHRIKFESINYAKGSATGYLSKYIAKNIDGFEVGEDYEATETNGGSVGNGGAGASGSAPPDSRRIGQWETDATNTSARVGAWASLWGIRQFQQIGGPQITIYRELRRIRSDIRDPGPGGAVSGDVVPIERARVFADAGDWSGFIKSIGGIGAGRKGSLALWKEIAVNRETGEVRANSFDEPRGEQIVGISSLAGNLRTRLKTWRIEKVDGGGGGSGWLKKESRKLRSESAPSPLGPVSITVAAHLPLISQTALQSGLARSCGETYGWTNPNETSMYGP